MKHQPPSVATEKGNMKQIRNNIKSNKTLVTILTEQAHMETMKTLSNNFFTNIINPQQNISTDLTVRFPVTSNQKNKYLFVLYKHERNSIILIKMKNRMDK